MGKSTFFTGQPVFAQLLSLVPKHLIESISRRYSADRYCKKLMTYGHVVTMLYACFHKTTSLRELTTGLLANSLRLQHLGLMYTPRRSTLADANMRRPAAIFAELYHSLYKRHFSLPDSPSKTQRLFIIDSTTISLFSSIMRGAGTSKADGRKKGGVKAHTLLDAGNNTPAFIHITEGKEHDLTFLSVVEVPAGSTVVMDKAYTKYLQFYHWNCQGVRWVTRTKNDASIKELQVRNLPEQSKAQGVMGDRTIQLGRESNHKQTKLITAREVHYFDKEKGRSFRFISNDMDCPAEEIAQLYKQRWQIELVFKRIKQNYPLRYFLGDSPNAIQIQVWASLLCDLLVRIVQQLANRTGRNKWAYANVAAMIRHHLMTYIDLLAFLRNPQKALLDFKPPNTLQLSLFNSGGFKT